MPVNKDYYTLAGSSGQSTGYTIEQSIRFARTDNSTGGSCMHRTPSGAGNRKKWTFSLWFKLGSMNKFNQGSGHYYGIFSVDAATNDANRAIWTIAAPSGGGDTFRMQFQGHGTIFMLTTREFRDPSAWYHAILVWDTAQSVASERQALYINGQKETAFQTFTNPTDEQEIGMNLASRTLIGASRNISTSQDIYRWDGYMTDIHFLDGYAYGPEYFGEFDSNGIWIPKEYTGSYGSNGFFIDGRDASDLGDDESGNGNDFTTINHGTDDQFSDTPTNNWCTMNSLVNNGCVYEEGNLKIYPPNNQTTHRFIAPTHGILPSDTNKYYWEIKYVASDSSSSVNILGAADLDAGRNVQSSPLSGGAGDYGIGYNTSTSNVYSGGDWSSNSPSWSGGFTNNSVYGVAFDGSTGRIYFYEDGTALNSGNHFATHNRTSTIGPGASLYYTASSSFLTFNLGANGFTHTPPTGYVAVNSINLGS